MAMTASILIWGIVGASTIAEEYVIPAIKAQGHDIQALFSATTQHAQQYIRKNNIPHSTTSLEQLFQRNKLDAVYISSTNEKHAPQAITAAQNGVHILCEKPIATSKKDASDMLKICKKHKVILAINHHLRCSSSVMLMKTMLQNNAIGKPIGIRLYHTFLMPKKLRTWRLNDPTTGAGVILDVLVHQADLLRFVLGEDPTHITCLQQFHSLGNREADVEDGSMTIMQFPSGVIAHTHETFTTPHTQTAMHILGTLGTLEGYDVMRQQGGGSVTLSDKKGRRDIPVSEKNCYETTVRQFVNSVLGKGKHAADGTDGLKALAIALAAKQSATTGRTQAINYQQ